jgi:acyl-CoA reductase-like NAD-dependent aldehyde dehydrogenase
VLSTEVEELVSVDPATLQEVGTVDVTSAAAIPEIVADAALAQRRWRGTSHAERRALLAAVASCVLDTADELAALVTAETGKPLLEAYLAELFLALEHLRWTAANAGKVLAPERLRFSQPYLVHKRGRLIREPFGVVAVISPWNFPFGIPFTQTIAAVAAGNAVVVKPSERAPLSGGLVERLFLDAGAPLHLVSVVHGGPEVGEALVRSEGVQKVFFTGSTAGGRRVAASAGERLCPVSLELGGKDAMLVLDDADLDRAVDGAVWGAFSNCGQSCASVERIFVARPLYGPFLEELASRAGALRIGRGSDLRTELGPLGSHEHLDRIERLVDGAVEDGAEIVTGGRRPNIGLPGAFYEPTVVARAPRSTPLMTEEIFGPVAAVAPVRDEDEAIELTNESAFGLSASVWTRDHGRAMRVAGRIDAGTVWTNDVQYSYAVGDAPWGGFKDSGFGRTHARHGLHECAQLKFADFDRGRVPVPWWYPYGEELLEGFRGLTHVLYGSDLVGRAAAAWRHRSGLLALGRRYLSRL